ncbi:Dynamin family protein [Anaerovirgula multivorans]|uniref:Dynamin family protein n=1 Tax=Anaerovirgula multivorans TaxID=312168 RepID=A0A239GLS2_9FIRM|nr:dynamin family protein [Anaerovirgula multivorans]SNS70070.1 Dynamin family protein [Anaerovirgula multivorans]
MGLMERYEIVNNLVEEIDNKDLKTLSKFLKARISKPDSYVMFLGETSSGKSSLINGLLGMPTLPVSATPTTGTITEVVLSGDQTSYYAINKDATMEVIDDNLFDTLAKKPDNQLERLRIHTSAKNIKNFRFDNLKLFDTPGYGSLISEHDIVLKEFIPNSDVVVYTVAYKIGIQENDYAFLAFLNDLIREDAKVVLVVNRCPQNVQMDSPRIMEIVGYAKDLLHSELPVFLVPECKEDETYGYPLPEAKELWSFINELINSENHKEILNRAFNHYVIDLFRACENHVNSRFAMVNMSNEERLLLMKDFQQLIDSYQNVIDDEIIPSFAQIIDGTMKRLDDARNWIEERTIDAIERQGTSKMDETITYVNIHALPFATKEEIKEVNYYIETEVNALDRRVLDMLNTAIAKFQKDVSIRYEHHLDKATKNIIGNMMENGLKSGLLKFFAKYGGAGGSGAGVANAASHYLKVVGDLFGKTFKRETHNALKHTLKKIGATSVKSLAVVAAVIVEVLMVVYEYARWKSKLKKSVKKGLDKWLSEIKPLVEKDLLDLKAVNIQTVTELIEDVKSKMEINPELEDAKKLNELFTRVNETKERLGLI